MQYCGRRLVLAIASGKSARCMFGSYFGLGAEVSSRLLPGGRDSRRGEDKQEKRVCRHAARPIGTSKVLRATRFQRARMLSRDLGQNFFDLFRSSLGHCYVDDLVCWHDVDERIRLVTASP